MKKKLSQLPSLSELAVRITQLRHSHHAKAASIISAALIIFSSCTACSASFFVGDRYKILNYDDIRRIDGELNEAATPLLTVAQKIMTATGMYPHSAMLKFNPIDDERKLTPGYTANIIITFTQVNPGIFGVHVTDNFKSIISKLPECFIHKNHQSLEDIAQCNDVMIVLPTYNSTNVYFGTMSLQTETRITDDLRQYPTHSDPNTLAVYGPLTGIDVMENLFNTPHRFYP